MKLFKRFLLLLLLLAALCTAAAAADYTAANIEEFCVILFDRLKEQDPQFSVEYTGTERLPTSEDGLFSLALLARTMNATLPNTDGTGPDLQMLNIEGARCTKEGDRTLNINIDYLQTPEQIAYVNEKADEIIASLNLDGCSDYLKIKKIYASQIAALDSNVSTGGGTDDTAAIQAVLDEAKDDNIGKVTITEDYIEKKGGPRIEMRGTLALEDSQA